ncbi:hypothetical protein ACOJA0_06995 [Corynebacterium amycolatum]|uniref:hypothetical protein n=1 Tax=Corynebacterium TaxID=1716 RepID=UPI000B29E06D|nr:MULTISPECIES: hypothetical protein [Corynebacterium]KAA9289902.1 hypothetical protein F6I11_01515 [Corynebacterium amycolatum]MBC6757620.1 hypothetical protein [Corynebacterium sp. LK24]MCT1719116.1 hypothetical protein [Corynebacterium amycolatum]MDK8818102.1 hypothetical protein [Corynebacterium amycolatum]
MAEAFDRVGQWLIQLPLLAQVSVLCAVLLVVGGFVAFVLVGAIDVVSGRLWQRSVRRRERSQGRRGAGSES